jgi:hypothetical protein
MPFLGKVHQMEKDCKGMGDVLGSFDRHRVDEPPRLARIATAAGVTRRTPQPLDVFVQVFAAGLGDDLAEQPTKQTHVLSERTELVRLIAAHDVRA